MWQHLLVFYILYCKNINEKEHRLIKQNKICSLLGIIIISKRNIRKQFSEQTNNLINVILLQSNVRTHIFVQIFNNHIICNSKRKGIFHRIFCEISSNQRRKTNIELCKCTDKGYQKKN